ncbi:ankyrin repeat domain-containing protein 16 [Erpetoichthys calabaricus]|uniref:Ankyrin repeat domain-containing protein 16 n=1 Tax=Erpetoichthys calabaricus TaxID=27687 RepID=A0A8C4SDZ3_ERPCA|nr:ankyrin repeat domain-containing protein 16 [Erpetoichthys calabaricus]
MGDEACVQSVLRLVQEGQLSAVKDKFSGDLQLQSLAKKTHFGKSGDTLLHYASRSGHLDMLRFFVEQIGFDTELVNRDYKRALHEAASMGHVDCVRYLTARGAKIDSLKKADWTPLMMACAKRNLDVIKNLINHGAKPALKNKDGWNCFHIACREGDPSIVHYLIDTCPEVWKTKSNTARTPLHTAAMHGCAEVVNILLDRCHFETDDRDSCGITPLMDALRNGHIGVAEVLMKKHQASFTASDNLGTRPVQHAAVTGQDGVICYLVQRLGVNINEQVTDIQLTALHLAAKEGHVDTIQTLLSLGADVQLKDVKGRTALHMACAGQHVDCVNILLEAGLQDCEDNMGILAKHLAKKQELLTFFDKYTVHQ